MPAPSPTALQGRARLPDLIHDAEVLTSAELIGRLQKTGFSEENARQVLRRRSKVDGVWRSEHLKLARNERLFAKAAFAGTSQFFAAVGKKLLETSRYGLARCLAAIGKHDVLHRVDVLRLLAVSMSAKPSRPSSLARLYRTELDGLHELGVKVIQRDTALESLVSPAAPRELDADAAALRAVERLRYETILVRLLAEHLRRQSVLSWNRIEIPDPELLYTVFNEQVFSGFGFSYLSPLVRWKAGSTTPTPCPVLIDCYHGACTLAQVQSFVQRIERATVRGRSRIPVLGIIGARDFERDAWDDARHSGLVTVSFRQMFGDEALDAMVRVEQLMQGIKQGDTSGSEDRFEGFSELLAQLKTNPVVVNLRSIGFEALCALILRSDGYEQVEMGRIVPWNTTKRDVDVFGVRGNELRVIECKAYHRKKSVLGEDVRKFFTETLPAVKQWLRANGKTFSRCTAEVWTTGPLGNDARNTLYGLKRPKSDEWTLKRMDDLRELIPPTIRERSIQLLESIALTESDGSDAQWQ